MSQMIDIRIAPNGRTVLPKAARAALGVTGASIVSLSLVAADLASARPLFAAAEAAG